MCFPQKYSSISKHFARLISFNGSHIVMEIVPIKLYFPTVNRDLLRDHLYYQLVLLLVGKLKF